MVAPGTQGLGHRLFSGPYPEPRGGDLPRAPRTWTPSRRGPYPEPRGESRSRHRGSGPSHSEGSRPAARGEHRAHLQGFGPPFKGAPARRLGRVPRLGTPGLRALTGRDPGQEARARASCAAWLTLSHPRHNPGVIRAAQRHSAAALRDGGWHRTLGPSRRPETRGGAHERIQGIRLPHGDERVSIHMVYGVLTFAMTSTSSERLFSGPQLWA